MAIKIFIDQGHNPQNPNAGAEAGGAREQDINFDIGIRLAALLESDPNFEVKVSRPTAETSLGTSNASSLAARVNAANTWGADYFISLHCNASVNTSASGTEAYAYSTDSQGFALGQAIIENISRIVGIPNRGAFARPSLYVLRRTAMPAVLIEMAYITNETDRNLLTNSPELFAEAIYQGILQYFGL